MKCTRIVTRVIGQCQKEELADILKREKFSILVDESTHFNRKTSALVVRFFHEGMGRMVGRLVDFFASIYRCTLQFMYLTRGYKLHTVFFLIRQVIGLVRRFPKRGFWCSKRERQGSVCTSSLLKPSVCLASRSKMWSGLAATMRLSIPAAKTQSSPACEKLAQVIECARDGFNVSPVQSWLILTFFFQV
jgi:hypothetical protein